MKLVLKILGALVLLIVLAGGGVYLWASSTSSKLLARTMTAPSVDFPIPFPLTPEELAAENLTPEEGATVARERAYERGRHLVEARYGCEECHGKNFGGGVMVDDPMLGTWLGPNLTSGEGSHTNGFTASDWDRIVRHGIRHDGKPGAMPSEDFQTMSDEELSDIVVYITSQPPVDNVVPAPTLGPLGKILIATGKIPLSADRIDHSRTHAVMPPAPEVSLEFGEHLAGVCRGCHGPNLAGGPIAGGDPSWPPARNLTPQPGDGLGGWTYDQFVAALRESRRPDGTMLREPMTLMAPYARNMTDVELQALWAYLQSVPAAPTPQ